MPEDDHDIVFCDLSIGRVVRTKAFNCENTTPVKQPRQRPLKRWEREIQLRRQSNCLANYFPAEFVTLFRQIEQEKVK